MLKQFWEVKHLKGMPSKNSGGSTKFPGGHNVIHRTAQTAFVRVVSPRFYCKFVTWKLNGSKKPMTKRSFFCTPVPAKSTRFLSVILLYFAAILTDNNWIFQSAYKSNLFLFLNSVFVFWSKTAVALFLCS